MILCLNCTCLHINLPQLFLRKGTLWDYSDKGLVFFLDIPLLPAISAMSGSGDGSFVVHWLNNKEFQFTLSAENIIDEMKKKADTSEASESQEDVTDLDFDGN